MASEVFDARNFRWLFSQKVAKIEFQDHLGQSIDMMATISFLFLSHNVKNHVLQQIVFLDNIGRESKNDDVTFKKEIHVRSCKPFISYLSKTSIFSSSFIYILRSLVLTR